MDIIRHNGFQNQQDNSICVTCKLDKDQIAKILPVTVEVVEATVTMESDSGDVSETVTVVRVNKSELDILKIKLKDMSAKFEITKFSKLW